MKGIICYYSGSGNTKLACVFIKNKIKNVEFELYNIVKNDVPDFSEYDFVGFASFTDFGAPPKYMYSFVEKISNQNGKNAFVFNTYGSISGKTILEFDKLVSEAGFKVLTGFSLHTPESYPPMRKRGMAFNNSPKDKDLKQFNEFVTDLDTIINDVKTLKVVEKRKLTIKLIGNLLPVYKRTQAKKDFGIQNVNEELCAECSICMKGCPYEAITMDPKPVFNHDICAGCWYCYNHCKQKAIYTPKFKGDYQYPKPSDLLRSKLN